MSARDHGARTEISAALNGDIEEETKRRMCINWFSCKGRGPSVLLGCMSINWITAIYCKGHGHRYSLVFGCKALMKETNGQRE